MQQGHGNRWLVTYSDMITLLMAFFIALITFSSTDNTGEGPQKRDSLVDGQSGAGVSGLALKGKPARDSIVWRPRFRPAALGDSGAEFASLYRNPSLDITSSILSALAGLPPGKLGDNYVLKLPRSLLVKENGKLTPSGVSILSSIAGNLRDLPYDFQFRVQRPDQVAQAVSLCTFLSLRGVHPGRLSVGVLDEDEEDTVWLMLSAQT